MSAITRTRFADRRFAWLGEPLPDVEISFEFFPAKTPAGEERLWQGIEKLKALQPSYVSVTCGAGGNPAEGTQALVTALRERAGLVAVPHLTCASAPRQAIEQIAASYRANGFRHIVALRGDRPKDGSHDDPDRYRFAADLVAALRRTGTFEISVAAYPEPHPEASSAAADFDNLKRKIDAGASRAITQYCFDTETVLRFRDRMSAAGITVPLAVGILPVHDFGQVRRFSERCGAGVPGWLCALFEDLDDDPSQAAQIGACVAAEQARRLIVEGIPQLHFYTLNRAELTIAACRLLGLRAAPARAAAAAA
jgi:methylenetetrahydrofolate reductase (NADPH)